MISGVMIGVFSALDGVLFYVLWEAMLIPMFLLIGIWGGPNRVYATLKFFLYTFLGSVFMLVGLIYLYLKGGSWQLADLYQLPLTATEQMWIFFAFLAAFAVKVPMFPVHTWLPDAHVQAPTAGSILLAGVLLKMGAYALIRLGGPLLPGAPSWFPHLLFWLGTISVLYGAWVCVAQWHLKRLIAYASIGHMGLVLVAISTGPVGVTPAVVMMVSHGLLSPLLFAIAGLIHERTGTFDIAALGGLARTMPRAAWLLVVAALGSMGLPGMSGFIAEWSVLIVSAGAFGILGLLPVLGVILTGAYTVLLITRTTVNAGFGAGGDEQGAHPLPFIILLAIAVVLGILPGLLLEVLP